MQFYDLGANVIVVLLLVTAVQVRYFRLVRHMGVSWNVAQVSGFAVVINGLVQALRTVQHHHATRLLGYGASFWVWLAIVLQLAVVTAIALRGGRDFEALKTPEPGPLGVYVRARLTFVGLNVATFLMLVALFAVQTVWGAYTLFGSLPIWLGFIAFAARVTRGGPTAPPLWPRWTRRFGAAIVRPVKAAARSVDQGFLK